MKVFLVLALALAVVSAVEIDLATHWNKFKVTHNKKYDSRELEVLRRAIFNQNVKKIMEHNLRADKSYQLAINKFADLTGVEFRNMMLGLKFDASSLTRKSNATATFMSPLNYEAPTTVDWRTKGYVTPVKNQGQCGSCWAFSTTGSLEGQHFRKTGKLVSLSEQQLVDCSTAFGDHGCQGGLMDNGFRYIKANKGIDTESSYPYTARNGQCKFNAQNVGATVAGFVDVKQGDEAALKTAVATVGPISVAIDASHFSFQFYHSGVYDEESCSSTQLDHGVLAVGYGTENNVDYWLVKNSWGSGWGSAGYIKMSRNRSNQCGIATDASYPLV